MRRTLPNVLSILRGPLGLAVLLVYSSGERRGFYTGVAIIAVALMTDILDGFLARKFGVASEKGYILDGLGDRAMYISLVLLLVHAHAVPLIAAWLIILREVLIYAQRLLQGDWYLVNPQVRSWSLLHAGGIRAWFLSYFVADGLRIHQIVDLYKEPLFRAGQLLTVLATIAISYYSLYRATTLQLHEDRGGGKVSDP